MDIGAQRGVRVYLKVYDWIQLICRTGRFLTALLFTLFIMITSAHAAVESVPAINVPPTIPVALGWSPGDASNIQNYFPTPVEACNKLINGGQYDTTTAGFVNQFNYHCYNLQGYSYNVGYNAYCPKPNYFIGYANWQNCSSFATTQECAALTCTLSGSSQTCPTPTVQPNIPYVLNTTTGMCDRTVPDCPANSSRSNIYPYQCTCNTGYKFDAVGGICVPLRECTIPDLPPITDPEVQAFEDNPNRSDTARLTSRMQTALTCLKTAAAAGSPSTGSAYRPPAYNQHLIDVWKKWEEFRKNKNYDQQDCAARKEKIRLHFKTHGLLETQQPVPNSDHTRGEAVDVSINLPSANIDALAAGCHLRRPVPVKDRVHFIYQ